MRRIVVSAFAFVFVTAGVVSLAGCEEMNKPAPEPSTPPTPSATSAPATATVTAVDSGAAGDAAGKDIKARMAKLVASDKTEADAGVARSCRSTSAWAASPS